MKRAVAFILIIRFESDLFLLCRSSIQNCLLCIQLFCKVVTSFILGKKHLSGEETWRLAFPLLGSILSEGMGCNETGRTSVGPQGEPLGHCQSGSGMQGLVFWCPENSRVMGQLGVRRCRSPFPHSLFPVLFTPRA